MPLKFFTRWIEQAGTYRGWECRLHIVGKVSWLVYFVKSYYNCRNVSFLIREMNEPVMVIQATLLFKSNYNFRVKYVLTTFLHSIVHIVWKQSFLYSCSFSDCKQALLWPLPHKKYTSVFFPWISHSSKRKLGRSFQNKFYKYLRVLNVIFSTQMNFSWTSSHFRVVCPLIAL